MIQVSSPSLCITNCDTRKFSDILNNGLWYKLFLRHSLLPTVHGKSVPSWITNGDTCTRNFSVILYYELSCQFFLHFEPWTMIQVMSPLSFINNWAANTFFGMLNHERRYKLFLCHPFLRTGLQIRSPSVYIINADTSNFSVILSQKLSFLYILPHFEWWKAMQEIFSYFFITNKAACE